MKIISLFAENILKLKAICIIPKSEVIEIKGDNAAGKSSVLDAIVFAFKGDRELPKQPIRKGAKKGIIKISLDGDAAVGIPPFTITRTFTDKSTSIKIEPETIHPGETPRSFMDKLIGKISFDPLQFINQEGKKQRAVLLNMIGVDVDSLDIKEKKIFDDRTIKGRELKTQQVKTDTAAKLFDQTIIETEEKKIADLSEQLTSAINFNNEISKRQAANALIPPAAIRIRDEYIPNSQAKISEWEELIRLEKIKIAELNKSLEDKRAQHKKEKEALALIELKDTDAINLQISTIEETNIKIRNNSAYRNEKQLLDAIQAEYDILEGKLENVRNERIQLLQSANMPVSGLSFDEDGLLYNGIPLSQCSDGEKLMVSMGISMALNPTMRVLRIKDGSLLGPANMEILRKMVKDKDYQLWLERVESKEQYDKNGGMGILIEEGIVAEEDGLPVAEIKPIKETEPVKKTVEKSLGIDKNNLPDDDF